MVGDISLAMFLYSKPLALTLTSELAFWISSLAPNNLFYTISSGTKFFHFGMDLFFTVYFPLTAERMVLFYEKNIGPM